MEPHPLKIERESHGWSQLKIADALGVSARTVGRWETRLAVPHPHYREQLSLLFGKTIEELGLLSDTDENGGAQDMPSLIGDFLIPDNVLLQDDPTSSEALIVQRWLTNSLTNSLLHEQDIKMSEQSTQAYEQETQVYEQETQAYDNLLFPQVPWVRSPLIKTGRIPFGTFSRHYMLISSIILLMVLAIIATPLAFNQLSLPKGKQKHASSSSKQDHSGTPLYTLKLENTDPSLSNTAQHLHNVFDAVYPQLVNRFALNSASAKIRTVTLTFSSNLALPATAKGTSITINTNWIQHHPTDVGLLTYELTLVIEQYPRGTPHWFADGVANYVRSVYGPTDDDDWSLPNGVQPQDKYQQGGVVTARFLLWLEQHSQLDIVDQLNHALQTKQSFSNTFHRLTEQTIDKLWGQYQAHPDLIQTPEQLYRTVTSRKPLYQFSSRVQITHWHTFKPIFAPGLFMSNFTIQADMTVFSGNGQAGFVFRNQNAVSYYLRMNLHGRYEIASQTQRLASGVNSAINRGINQTNRLTIVAQKHTIYLYINGQFITKIDDSSSSYGAVGVMAVDETKVTDVRFANVQVI